MKEERRDRNGRQAARTKKESEGIEEKRGRKGRKEEREDGREGNNGGEEDPLLLGLICDLSTLVALVLCLCWYWGLATAAPLVGQGPRLTCCVISWQPPRPTRPLPPSATNCSLFRSLGSVFRAAVFCLGLVACLLVGCFIVTVPQHLFAIASPPCNWEPRRLSAHGTRTQKK